MVADLLRLDTLAEVTFKIDPQGLNNSKSMMNLTMAAHELLSSEVPSLGNPLHPRRKQPLPLLQRRQRSIYSVLMTTCHRRQRHRHRHMERVLHRRQLQTMTLMIFRVLRVQVRRPSQLLQPRKHQHRPLLPCLVLLRHSRRQYDLIPWLPLRFLPSE